MDHVLLDREQIRAIRSLRFDSQAEKAFQEEATTDRIRRIRIVVVALVLFLLIAPRAKEVTATPLMKQVFIGTGVLTLGLITFVFIPRFKRYAVFALPIWHLCQQIGFGMSVDKPEPFMQVAIELSLAIIIVAAVRSPAILSLCYVIATVAVRLGTWSYKDLPAEAFSSALTYLCLGLTFLVIGAYLTETADRKSFLVSGLLEVERQRTHSLLTNVLPASVAERLKNSTDVFATRHDSVTILFADVANFTPFAAERSPAEVVGFLNDLFSRFDELVDTAGLEKIKTVGDAYMVAGGLPEAREDHIEAMASLALEIKGAAAAIGASVRFGIHTGPAVAGVLGSKRLMYDVWGPTVNLASRLEGAAKPGQIIVSHDVARKLEGAFDLSAIGTVDLKGVGEVDAYVLNRRLTTPMALS